MSDSPLIGVGRDSTGWYTRVVEALEAHARQGSPIRVAIIDVEAHDWLNSVRGLDALIWNPFYMGPIFASMLKEKVHFLEQFANVRVMPSFPTVWHFESKVAQSYVFEALDLPRPRTIVSFEYRDAAQAAQQLGLPVVAKKSSGASGENVILLRSEPELETYLQREFAQQHWDELKSEKGSSARAAISAAFTPWLREKILRTALGHERHGYVYLQEFIEGNDSDLRILVIGRRALGFWRANRENDFRASGSGVIDTATPIPREALALCLDTSARLGADSLAYDLIFRDGQPLIVEVSYSCPPETVSTLKEHWVMEPGGSLTRVEATVWPQDLWVEHLLEEFAL